MTVLVCPKLTNKNSIFHLPWNFSWGSAFEHYCTMFKVKNFLVVRNECGLKILIQKCYHNELVTPCYCPKLTIKMTIFHPPWSFSWGPSFENYCTMFKVKNVLVVGNEGRLQILIQKWYHNALMTVLVCPKLTIKNSIFIHREISHWVRHLKKIFYGFQN